MVGMANRDIERERRKRQAKEAGKKDIVKETYRELGRVIRKLNREKERGR